MRRFFPPRECFGRANLHNSLRTSDLFFGTGLIVVWRTRKRTFMKLMYPTQSNKIILTALFTAALLIAGIMPASAQSDYNRTNTNNNLPALIMSFTAEMQSEAVVLNWVMENQTSCKWFVIERSNNGSQYDSIAIVMGTNNTHHTDYAYTDARVLNGNNYYRLRQVDMDGSLKYSKVVCLNNSAVTKIRVYPNPAVAVVNYALDIPAAQQVTVQVYNLAGAVVMTQQQSLAAGANQQSLAIGGLKNGNYFLRISSGNGTQYAQPFVKML